jgi:hypothetical protein
VEIIEKTHASWAKLRAQPNVAPSLWLGNWWQCCPNTNIMILQFIDAYCGHPSCFYLVC